MKLRQLMQYRSAQAAPASQQASPRRHLLENWVLSSALGLMAAIPVVELALRLTLHTGLMASASLVQHLGLAVGMLGGAVATREDRLLKVSALANALPERSRGSAHRVTSALAAAVCVVLCAAESRFVLAERLGAAQLGYGIPIWAIEALMPIGFALIGWRLLARVTASRGSRLAGLAVAAALALAAFQVPMIGTAIFASACAAIIIGALLGMPLFAVLAGITLLLFWHAGEPLASVAVDHYRTVINPTLPAIPLFTLAGYLLAESGAPRRLIEVFDALFGRLRGGPAVVTVLSCTFFTSFTGASGATVLALGGLIMPLLLATGYKPRSALGLATAAGLPGTLLMPALPLILYAIVAGIGIEQMFLGGAIPALCMALILIVFGIRLQDVPRGQRPQFDLWRACRALYAAKWELSVPLVPMLALATGIATPVECAALTALYVLLITTLIHKDLGIGRDLPRVTSECGLIVGGILLVMGVALGLTDFIVDAEVPEYLVTLVSSVVSDRTMFLLALNGFLLLAGCLIEIYPAIVVLAPIIIRLGSAYGVDPIHLGVIFLANMELGYLTPLVGLNLFFASYRFNKTIAEVFRAVLPLFIALAIGVLLITFVPELTLALPRLLH
jgi:C4-dicarboxylate transporter DctM subunit